MDIPLAETGLKGSLSWSRGQSQSCRECAAVNAWPHSWPHAWKVFTSEQHHKSSTARNYIKGFFGLHFIDLSKKNPKSQTWAVIGCGQGLIGWLIGLALIGQFIDTFPKWLVKMWSWSAEEGLSWVWKTTWLLNSSSLVTRVVSPTFLIFLLKITNNKPPENR